MASTHATTEMKTSAASAPPSDKAAAAPDFAVKYRDAMEEEWQTLPSEIQTMNVPPDWEAKPCVRITGLGGLASEEELLTLLTSHGPVSSIVFENEIRDSAIIRFEHSEVRTDDVATRVADVLNNTEFKTVTIAAESYRSDSLLFVGNLTHETDDAQLRTMFEAHGTIERAFVLRNTEGQSKGYGFVEYSLKSQASVAKIALGTVNIDGRAIRVEWSDCRRVSEMFSSVLFLDRIPKDSPNIESILRKVFGKYGKVKDCHLVVGVNQQLRGFGFIDFYHSKYADKAHRALDGYNVNGFILRVSFANPSKSVQSYKARFDNSVLQGGKGFGAFKGPLGFPYLGSRFLGSGMHGMAFNMFGHNILSQAIAAQLFGLNPYDPAFQGTPNGVARESSGPVPFPSSTSSQEQAHESAVASYYKPSDLYYGYGQSYEGAMYDTQNSGSQHQYYQSEQQYFQPQTQLASSSQPQYSYVQENGQDYGQEQVQQQSYGETTPAYPGQYEQTTHYQLQSCTPQGYMHYDSQLQAQQPLSHDQTVNPYSGYSNYATVPQYQESSQFHYYPATTPGVVSQAAETTQDVGTGSSEQSLEAQWAAYYAAQAANGYSAYAAQAAPEYSQAAPSEVGQKRSVYQMGSASQSIYEVPAMDYGYRQPASLSYVYQQQASPPTFNYLHGSSDGYQLVHSTQQPLNPMPAYRQPATAPTTYEGHSVSDPVPVYYQPAMSPAATIDSHAVQQLPGAASSSYQLLAADSVTPQQPLQHNPFPMSYLDHGKRPRF